MSRFFALGTFNRKIYTEGAGIFMPPGFVMAKGIRSALHHWNMFLKSHCLSVVTDLHTDKA